MLTDDRLRSIDDYLSASDVFQALASRAEFAISLDGTIAEPAGSQLITRMSHWKQRVASFSKRVSTCSSGSMKDCDPEKGRRVESGGAKSLSLPEKKRFDLLVSSRKPFGLETTSRARWPRHRWTFLSIRTAARATSPEVQFRLAFISSISGRCTRDTLLRGTGNKDTYPHRIISTPIPWRAGHHPSETYLLYWPIRLKKTG